MPPDGSPEESRKCRGCRKVKNNCTCAWSHDPGPTDADLIAPQNPQGGGGGGQNTGGQGQNTGGQGQNTGGQGQNTGGTTRR